MTWSPSQLSLCTKSRLTQVRASSNETNPSREFRHVRVQCQNNVRSCSGIYSAMTGPRGRGIKKPKVGQLGTREDQRYTKDIHSARQDL